MAVSLAALCCSLPLVALVSAHWRPWVATACWSFWSSSSPCHMASRRCHLRRHLGGLGFIRSRRGLATGCMPPAFYNVPLGLLFLPSVARAPFLRTRSGGAEGRNGAAERGIVEGWGACVPPLSPTHDAAMTSLACGFYRCCMLGRFCDFSAVAGLNSVNVLRHPSLLMSALRFQETPL